jgi:tetratricopeptide (TPR) repeat protein
MGQVARFVVSALVPLLAALPAGIWAACPAVAAPVAPAAMPAPAADRQLHAIEMQLAEGKVSQETVSLLQGMLKQRPGNARAHLLLGRCLEHLGYEGLALEQYRQAAALAPAMAEPHYYLASLYFSLGQREEALTAAEQCHRLLRGNPAGLFRLGLALERRNFLDKAEQLYREASADAGRAPGVAAALAHLHNWQGRHTDALSASELELARDPYHAAANLEKGKALMMLGRVKESVAPLQRAFDINPIEPGLPDHFSRALEHQGRPIDALKVALFGIPSASSSSSVRLDQAKQRVAHLMSKLPAHKARATVLEVGRFLDRTPYGAYFHFAMGDVYDSAREPYFARQEYRAGLAIQPDFARGLFRLGKDEEFWFHNYDLALELYERAARLSPQDPEIAASLKRLRATAQTRRNDLAGHFKDWLWSLWLSIFKAPASQR